MSDNKHHDNHEEGSGIDQINDRLTAAGVKVANNKKIIYWSVGAILVIAAFVLSYFFIYRNPRLNKSFEAYNKVEMTALGNDTIAAKEYAKVADQHSGTTAGNLARLSAAESYFSIGNYAEAAKHLEEFSSKDDVLEANAVCMLGDCYVNLKKYDKAIEAFNKAVKIADKNPQIVPRVLLKEAAVYDAQNKFAQALECYTRIKNDYPQFQPGNVSIDAYIERENARLGK